LTGKAYDDIFYMFQHSMVYFYHHYELPAILRQAHQPVHIQTENPNTGSRQQNNTSAGQASPSQSHPPPPAEPGSSPGSENDLNNDNRLNIEIIDLNSSPAETNIITNPSSDTTTSGAHVVGGTSTSGEVEDRPPLLQTEEIVLTSSSRDFSSLSQMTSAPTIFNDQNINIVNHNLDRHGDGMMRDNSRSGVNNNDCNPTRVGLGQSSESTTSTSQATSTFSPAQVLGCSSESQLNLRMDVGDVIHKDSTRITLSGNPSPLRRESDDSTAEAPCPPQSGVRHRLPRESTNGRGKFI